MWREREPGLTDSDVLAQSVSEECILLTEDRDFGELIFREQKSAYGVILLRIPPEERSKKSERITTLVQHYLSELLGAMVIVTLNTIRIRSLPKVDDREEPSTES